MGAEYKRTCRKCGTAWYVSSQQAKEKRPTKSQESAATLLSIGTLGMAGGLVAANETRAARVDAVSKCPSCGSTKFTQVKDGWLNQAAEKAEAQAEAENLARDAVIERYLTAGSPRTEHEPPALPPGVPAGEVLYYARAAKRVLKASGKKIGFVAADQLARTALWYSYENPETQVQPTGKTELGDRIDADTRSCPMCAEPIKVQARKCKHCGSEVEPLE